MDGDVEMKTRGERGGKRYQMRKQKAMRQDTNMQDAEVSKPCIYDAAWDCS